MVSKITIKIVITFFIVIFMIPCGAVIPPAQSITGGSGIVYSVNKNGTITFPGSNEYMKIAADWLAQKLNKGDEYHWHVIRQRNNSEIFGEIEIYTMPKDNQIPYKKTDKRYHEAYIIYVGKKIRLYAGGSAGALYGVQRLFEMIQNGSLMQSSTIIDYPDYKWRGVYTSFSTTTCGDPYWLKAKQKKDWQLCVQTLIDNWRLLRINCLFIQSPIFYRLNGNDIQLLDDLFNYARKNNIEPVPVLASKLWDIPIDRIKQDAIEGVFHKDVKFKAESGSLVPLKNNTTDSASYTWAIKHNLFLPDWHIESDTENTKREHIYIDQSANNDPWKNPVFLENAAGKIHLAVQPGQYYEFMLSIRSRKYHGARIFITAIELDNNGDALKGLHRYSSQLFTTADWRMRWIPIFTSKNTHAISLQISAKNISDETMHIEVANPTLIPMKNQLINVLVNNETAPIIKSNDDSKQYIRGKDYEIRQVLIKEWSGTYFKNIKKTEIILLPTSKIQNGQIINISFDTLPLEYRAIPVSKYSTASRYTYKEYHRIFNRLKWLSPKFIHVALDEHAGGLSRDSRSKNLDLCNRDLFVGYINTLDSLLRDHANIKLPQGGSIGGVGLTDTKLIIWDDMLNPWHNGSNTTYQVPYGGVSGTTNLKSKADCTKNTRLHKTVLLASWWYRSKDNRGVVKKTPSFYGHLGYQYFMSTWYQRGGISNWLKTVKPSDTLGFIATTWSKKEQGVPIMACMAWNRKTYKKCLLHI